MIEIKKEHPDYIVTLIDVRRLNVNVAGEFKKETSHLIENIRENIVLDMSDINFIDTKGFSTLLELNAQATKKGNKLLLTNVSDDVHELIRLMNLQNVLQVINKPNLYAA